MLDKKNLWKLLWGAIHKQKYVKYVIIDVCENTNTIFWTVNYLSMIYQFFFIEIVLFSAILCHSTVVCVYLQPAFYVSERCPSMHDKSVSEFFLRRLKVLSSGNWGGSKLVSIQPQWKSVLPASVLYHAPRDTTTRGAKTYLAAVVLFDAILTGWVSKHNSVGLIPLQRRYRRCSCAESEYPKMLWEKVPMMITAARCNHYILG